MLLPLRLMVDHVGTAWSLSLCCHLFLALRRALWERGSFAISKVCRKKASKSSCWFKSEMLQKNAALPSGTWSHWKPMCSGEMRTGFPKQVAGLVSCLGSPKAVWVLLLAQGRGKEHVAGKVDRASPFSSRRDCGAAGIASLLVAKTQIPITGREASFGLQMLRIAPEQEDIAPPLPGTQA